MRLIDGDQLIKNIEHEYEETIKNGGIEQLRTVWKRVIKNAPTIEERPTGEWIPVMHRNYFGMLIDCFQCSNCNLYTLPQIKIMITEKLRICPNCGAKMKGEAE